MNYGLSFVYEGETLDLENGLPFRDEAQFIGTVKIDASGNCTGFATTTDVDTIESGLLVEFANEYYTIQELLATNGTASGTATFVGARPIRRPNAQ